MSNYLEVAGTCRFCKGNTWTKHMVVNGRGVIVIQCEKCKAIEIDNETLKDLMMGEC